MSVSIKRLGPGDEATLELLARDDAAFYRGSGFRAEEQPLYMTRELELPSKRAASTLMSG